MCASDVRAGISTSSLHTKIKCLLLACGNKYALREAQRTHLNWAAYFLSVEMVFFAVTCEVFLQLRILCIMLKA